jgi:hypothetical protein
MELEWGKIRLTAIFGFFNKVLTNLPRRVWKATPGNAKDTL